MQIELEQTIVVNFLTRENLNADEILGKFQANSEDTVRALQTVRFWMGEVPRGREDFRDENCAERPHLDYIDIQIMRILAKSSFNSVQSTGQTLNISHNVVLQLVI
jgi:hypothetical protein